MAHGFDGDAIMSTKRIEHRDAFTLIELLVVIGIIAVLVGIGLAVGLGVINSSRAGTTQNTILMLEGYLSDLDAAGKEPSEYKAYSREANGQRYEFPVVDGRSSTQGTGKTVPAISSLMRFIAAGDVYLGDSSGRWGGLDSSLVREGLIGSVGSEDVRGVELTDQWDNPIRVVHPAYDGGYGDFWNPTTGSTSARNELSLSYPSGGGVTILRLRRSYRPFNPTDQRDADSIGDADEGICQGERVYFYSAGPDGDPGTREDNVYGSTRPKFPAETADFE